MKIAEGNSYICTKEWKDVKGRTVPAGAICYANKSGLLCGYVTEAIYSQVEPLEDYGECFALYEESPYNKENRELKERYAGMALVGYMSGVKLWDKKEEVAKKCVSYADALITELRKE